MGKKNRISQKKKSRGEKDGRHTKKQEHVNTASPVSKKKKNSWSAKKEDGGVSKKNSVARKVRRCAPGEKV